MSPPLYASRHSGSYRAVWLSDLHLGSPACQAGRLLAFLRTLRCDTLYLVGDVVDGLRLRDAWYWPASHQAVLDELLRIARRGTEVQLLPGNHDAFLRAWMGVEFSHIRVAHEAAHRTADGRVFWVVHGDLLDPHLWRTGWTARLGRGAYRLLDGANLRYNHWRERRSRPRLSLHALVRRRVPAVERHIRRFETAMAKEARRLGFDGVICGHIHRAWTGEMEGVRYGNAGDWVDSCTALVEHGDGRIELLETVATASRCRAI